MPSYVDSLVNESQVVSSPAYRILMYRILSRHRMNDKYQISENIRHYLLHLSEKLHDRISRLRR